MTRTNWKYELTDYTINHRGITLYRIRALRDFGNVKAGDDGGFVQSERNLDSYGDSWIAGNAKVYGNAKVSGNAKINGGAQIYEDASITHEASVFGSAHVYGAAQVYGEATVHGDSQVYGEARVSDTARVYGLAKVYDSAQIHGEARVHNTAKVYGAARVFGSAKVSGRAKVFGRALVHGAAVVSEDAELFEDADVRLGVIGENAALTTATDYVVFSNVGSELGVLTVYRTHAPDGMWAVRGCFSGTLEQFLAAVTERHGDSRIAKEYQSLASVATSRILKPI